MQQELIVFERPYKNTIMELVIIMLSLLQMEKLTFGTSEPPEHFNRSGLLCYKCRGGDAKVSFVDVRDIASVAAKILIEEDDSRGRKHIGIV